MNDCTGSVKRRTESSFIHEGVFVDFSESLFAGPGEKVVEIGPIVNSLEVLPGRCRSFNLPDEIEQLLRNEAVADCVQSLRSVRVTPGFRACEMTKTVGVGKKSGRHDQRGR